MRILEHDELASELEADVQLLRLSVGWAPRDFSRTEEARRAGYPSTDYFGLYAVEDNRVLSTVRVLRVPYTFPDGHVESVSAILSVITRGDHRGRGLARGLMKEVHERERRAGSRFSLLWTDVSLTAHPFYESMGYRDVYAPDFATKRPSGRSLPRGVYTLEKATRAGLARVERFHALATRDRIGFTPRPPGYLRSQVRFGLFKPESFRLILRGGRPVGYLELQEGPSWVKVSEVVLPSGPSDATGLLPVLERLSAGRWLSLWNTFVRDSRKILTGRMYSLSNLDNHVLMAMPLDGSNLNDLAQSLGTADPRFVCHVVDYF